ncbi:hypothetical protein B0H16DRAFT_1835926 [Mycena metata]|uniref:Uncharacterized protein n=1 Tax=Mycena metata TaxID=1033252 RepID=A0AAD7NB41_9AGAR|nr:hypothetical protein B0H16DRAFT_1835926 [Mycena metata]
MDGQLLRIKQAEYTYLTPTLEREIFQRVQQGMQLATSVLLFDESIFPSDTGRKTRRDRLSVIQMFIRIRGSGFGLENPCITFGRTGKPESSMLEYVVSAEVQKSDRMRKCFKLPHGPCAINNGAITTWMFVDPQPPFLFSSTSPSHSCCLLGLSPRLVLLFPGAPHAPAPRRDDPSARNARRTTFRPASSHSTLTVPSTKIITAFNAAIPCAIHRSPTLRAHSYYTGLAFNLKLFEPCLKHLKSCLKPINLCPKHLNPSCQRFKWAPKTFKTLIPPQMFSSLAMPSFPDLVEFPRVNDREIPSPAQQLLQQTSNVCALSCAVTPNHPVVGAGHPRALFEQRPIPARVVSHTDQGEERESSGSGGWTARLEGRHISIEGGLSQVLDWDTQRGRDFQNVAHFVHCCDGYPDQNLFTAAKMDKWLSRVDPPGEQCKRDIDNALSEFGRVVTDPALKMGFSKVPKGLHRWNSSSLDMKKRPIQVESYKPPRPAKLA